MDTVLYKLNTMDKNRNVCLHILKDDLDSLNGSSWLTDTIIYAYLHTFLVSCSLHVLSYYTSTQIVSNGRLTNVSRKVFLIYKINNMYLSLYHIFEFKNLSNYHYIAGHVIINNNHWTLFFVNNRSATIYYPLNQQVP